MDIFTAAYNGNVQRVKELIRNGANVNAYTDYGTILIYASRGGHIDVVKELIKNGANVNAVCTFGTTPLMWAAENGLLEIVKELIRNGANVDARDKFRRTPLTWASREGHLKSVKELIKAGANVNARDRDGMTPLTWASRGGHLKIVKYLREQQLKVYTTKTGQKQGHQQNLRVIRALPGGTDYQKAMDRFNKINMKFNKFGKIKISSKNRKNAKKYKVRLTVNKNGKRVYKTNQVLEGQIKLN
jgi:hypothetical protein